MRLQSLEADIMVFEVLKTLQDEGHLVLPLHDAIFCHSEETLRRAKELIQKEFLLKHGLAVRFKDERAGYCFQQENHQAA